MCKYYLQSIPHALHIQGMLLDTPKSDVSFCCVQMIPSKKNLIIQNKFILQFKRTEDVIPCLLRYSLWILILSSEQCFFFLNPFSYPILRLINRALNGSFIMSINSLYLLKTRKYSNTRHNCMKDLISRSKKWETRIRELGMQMTDYAWRKRRENKDNKHTWKTVKQALHIMLGSVICVERGNSWQGSFFEKYCS